MKLPAKRAASAVLGLMMAAQLTAIPTSAAAAEGFENGSALNMTQIARYTSGQFNVDGGVMEIICHAAGSQRHCGAGHRSRRV